MEVSVQEEGIKVRVLVEVLGLLEALTPEVQQLEVLVQEAEIKLQVQVRFWLPQLTLQVEEPQQFQLKVVQMGLLALHEAG